MSSKSGCTMVLVEGAITPNFLRQPSVSRMSKPPSEHAGSPAQSTPQEPRMIAVIFEVWPADGRNEDYLQLAQRLREELQRIDGFISVERFQSLSEPGKL